MSTERPKRPMYLSVEELWRLSNAVRPVEEAFGNHPAFLVGSVLERDNWRDVDVRIIIPDSEYDRLFTEKAGLWDPFRMLIQTAVSHLLRHTTGLPVDFQVQSQYEADRYPGQRNALTSRPYIQPDFVPQWADSKNQEVGR